MTDHPHVDDPAVAAVLAAAAAPAEGPMPGEAAALAVFRSVHHPGRRPLMSRFSEKAKLIAAAVFGGVVVISGAATAATGSLPLVGSSHGHPHPSTTHSPDGTDSDQGDDDATDTSTDGTTPQSAPQTTAPDNGKGSAVSQLAHQLPQGHKGPAVCTLASGGKCQAGQHGKSGDATHGKSGDATHGKSGDSHGQNDAATHGQSDVTTHGQSGAATHGKSGLTTHGKSGLTTHGKSGQPHGSSSTS